MERICIVSYAYFPARPRELRQTLALKRQGYEVDVICNRQRVEKKYEIVQGVNVFRLPLLRKRGSFIAYTYRYALSFVFIFFKLSILYLFKRYSIIQVNSIPDFLVFTCLIPKLSGARIALDMMDPMPELYITKFRCQENAFMVRCLRLIEKMSTRFADAVLTQNNGYALLFSRREIPKSKITVLHNSAQEHFFGPIRNPSTGMRQKGKFVMLFHGTITERHGLETAVRSICFLRNKISNVQLQIVGGGEYFGGEYTDKITKLAANLNVKEYVWFRGSFKVEDIPSIIEQTDIGVIPNRKSVFAETNLPNRVFEYLWMGKPVAMSRTQGVLNYFDDSSIMYFEPDNPEDMARAVLNLYNNPEQAKELVANAQRICQKYRWETEKKKYIRLIERLS